MFLPTYYLLIFTKNTTTKPYYYLVKHNKKRSIHFTITLVYQLYKQHPMINKKIKHKKTTSCEVV
ncbi:hypothetical protein SAMN05444143_101308 [Flavobacterium succinicans]|uniref:Uncharacterized protein n=1 Tax=Flavobacterium succinicans TaxID=29536 RepID=A0A1I4RD20_9FLAO|nr:hypothetical protein SAMN05444143_101308 [Flavobacterium succinicans]